MPRPFDPQIHERLREQAVDYVLSHGFADLALRPLAKCLNTSARMLMYHFESREKLMQEVLVTLRQREGAVIDAWFRKSASLSLADFLRWYWKRISSARARSAARLIFELYALALREPARYPGILTDPLVYWQNLARRAGLDAKQGTTESTLLLAATRGLLLDLCATGDQARVQGALSLLIRLLEPSARHPQKANRRKRGA
jgi:AcrR family transcriptional regulator